MIVIVFYSRLNVTKSMMTSRKPFKDLSKSQKNRRLKQVAHDESVSLQVSPSSIESRENTRSFIISDTENIFDHVVMTENNSNVIIEDKDLTRNSTVTNDVTDGSVLLKNQELSGDYHDNIGNENIYDTDLMHVNNIPLAENLKVSLNEIPEMNNLNINLQRKLAQWQCQYNISQAACGALLKILVGVNSVEDLRNLPIDARTLLNTPKNTTIRPVEPGEYFHYGLERGLIEQLRVIDISNLSTNILINVHDDGLPISKSSKSQLYPILGEIFPKVATPFVIGVYHGHDKPSKCDEYLEDFINEYNTLHKKGFEFNYKKVYVTIRAVIADSPARAFVKQTKGHTGYYGCSKCIQEGSYSDHRMRFLQTGCPLRTDDNFRKKLNEDHHIGTSKFEQTEVDMVSQFPVEYMHLVCLGVQKKIISSWMKGWQVDEKTRLKFSHTMIKNISALLTSIKTWIPSEFVRKTRDLGEVDRWKATEFRLFLLYVGPIVLKGLFCCVFWQLVCNCP